MPYSNIIGISVGSLEAVVKYMGDATHDHHAEYEITPIDVLALKSVANLLAYAKQAFDANKRPTHCLRVGRPARNAAMWAIVRFPDGTWLTAMERDIYQKAACDELGAGFSLAGLRNWHLNRLSGSADLNIFGVAFMRTGVLLRDRRYSPIRSLRRRMDQITESMNAVRVDTDVQPIQTMQMVQTSAREARQELDIPLALSRMPKPPLKSSELEAALLSLDCQVERFSLDEDEIWIVLARKKKAIKLQITKLLASVHEQVLAKAKELTQLAETLASPNKVKNEVSLDLD